MTVNQLFENRGGAHIKVDGNRIGIYIFRISVPYFQEAQQ